VAFLAAGLPAYVIIPGMLVILDRDLDNVDGGECVVKKSQLEREDNPSPFLFPGLGS